jgi:hypothetical protein
MKQKFPYGACDFYQISTENYFYQDRTDRIRLLEETGKNILLLRPRRFGKSLFLSVLQNYYDLAKADKFEQLFGHLAIGKNPTPLHNQYFILKWDFSLVNPQGDVQAIEQSLFNRINGFIEEFIIHYDAYLEQKIRIDRADALSSFQSVLNAIHNSPHRLYLLIDEYDNFANEVMVSRDRGQQRYADLTMIIRPDMRQFKLSDHVIEFKYLSLKDVGLSGAEVRQLSTEELRNLEAVKSVLTGAEEQLTRYRQGLTEIYGDILRLHEHVVIAVGFERLVWVMINYVL